MARNKAVSTPDPAASKLPAGAPRSLAIATKGISTANDFALMMSTLMSDLIEGRVTAQVGNSVANAGGKLLRVVELQYKYGTAGNGKPDRKLQLTVEG